MLVTLVLLAAMPDQMVPIRAGKWRCGSPDVAHKICHTITRYEQRPDGTLDVYFRGMPIDGLTLSYHTTGRVDGDGLCLRFTEADLDGATFTIAGVTLTGAARDRQMEGMRGALGPLVNRKSCTRDEAIEGVFQAEDYLDGQRMPEYDKDVMWVDPDAGFTLPMPELT